MSQPAVLSNAQLEEQIVDYFLNVWDDDMTPGKTLAEKLNGDTAIAAHVLKTWMNTPNYVYLTRVEVGDVSLRRWIKSCLDQYRHTEGATATPARSARERLSAVKASIEGGEPQHNFQQNLTKAAGAREVPQTTTPAIHEGRNMPANTQAPGAPAAQGESNDQSQRPAHGRLIYKEGDIAIFLNTRQGPTGAFHVYGIVDGPQNGPDTKHYSMPVKVDGFDIECSERTRGGDVMNLYRGQQVLLQRRLENPIPTEDGVLTHIERLVEVRDEARGNFVNLQPYVAIPVFRRDAQGHQEGRPIGYRIPAQDWTPELGKQLAASGERIPNLLVWRKQGEKGGKNIFLSIPEAYDLRDGKRVNRDGVELSRAGISDDVIKMAVKVNGRAIANDQGQGGRAAAPQARPSFAPGGRLARDARNDVAASEQASKQEAPQQTESQQQPAQRGSRRR